MPAYKDEKAGKWYCKFYYTDWTGKKRQKLKRGFDRQRDAKDWERIFLEQYATTPDIAFRSLYDKYVRFKENRVKRTTLDNQKCAIELHILPFFGDMLVSEITPADVAEWQNQLLSEHYSAAHTRQINAYLRMLFRYAINYLGLQKSPVIGQICKPTVKQINYWTPEEYKLFSDNLKDNIELYTAFEMLFYTGMRKGELLALTLKDIDFEKKTIRINKTLAYISGEYVAQSPKTVKSNRIIEAPDFLLEEIKAYIAKLYCPESKQRLFMRSRVWLGQAITYNCERLNMKRIRVHDLRHSHASLLINLGANPLMIAERLGHEDVKVTMNTYGHLFQSHQKDIIDKLDAVKNSII